MRAKKSDFNKTVDTEKESETIDNRTTRNYNTDGTSTVIRRLPPKAPLETNPPGIEVPFDL